MNIVKAITAVPQKNYKPAFYLMLLALTLIGFYKGVIEEGGAKDAQWFPAKLFSENIDFYNYYLENFNDWFMRNVPNYYFQLYYLLQPISSVSWDTFKLIWFVGNLALLFLFLYLVKRDFRFDYRTMSIILLPFFIGYPLISVFSLGQSTLLIIILAYLAWKYRDNRILLPVLLSLLTFKYSFGLPIVFGFLLMGYFRSVFISALITLVFPLIYSFQFNLNFISTIFLPFQVTTNSSANALGGGPANLMSLYELYFDGPLIGLNVLTISLAIFLILFSIASIKYSLYNKTIFLGSLLFSLFGFYHNGHDYALFLLIVPFVYNVKYFKVLYGYLLLFCMTPRIIRLLNIFTDERLGVKEFLYNKYFVLFNVSFLIAFFIFIVIKDIRSRNEGTVPEYMRMYV